VKKILLATVLLTLIGCSKQSDNNENMTQPAVAQPEIEEKVILKSMPELLASQDTYLKLLI
jgi:lipoprotein NlpI